MRGPAALVVLLLGLALAAPRASAQVELDGSMNGTSGLVPGGDGATFLIQESFGRRSGPNLFHSFSRFDIPLRSTATFTGDPGVERIVGRVTGGLTSQIAGTIRSTVEGADLYLINPRGFLFSGAERSLDVRGSFYLSSADNLRFEDGVTFPAEAISGEILSAAAPSAWGFTSQSTLRTIRLNQARDFEVPTGETLEVVGGPVFVSGFSGRATLVAPGGTIALASQSAPGEVPVDVEKLSARDAAIDELGSVSVANAFLDVSDPTSLAPSRGRIVIRGGALTVDSSVLSASSAADAATDAPDIDLETTRSIVLRRNSGLDAAARDSAVGGGVRISSESVALSGGSTAASTAADSGRAGDLDVDAGGIDLAQSSLATSATGAATAARISVDARNLVMSDSAQIGSLNDSSADAPEVEISVEELLQLGTLASLGTATQAEGDGASLLIEAGTLVQSAGARIASGTTGLGAGGDIDIRASTIDLSGDSLASDPGGVFATSLGLGASGGIAIDVDEIDVRGGAQISATAEGSGRGGDIEIAADTLDLSGASTVGPSGVFARSGLARFTPATGDGGNVEIEASSVSVSDGAEISTQTFGAGNAGDVRIAASESLRIAGGAATPSSINAKTYGSGSGGVVAIATSELRVDDGADITASTLYTGDSGDVRIEADRVYLGGGAMSSAGPAGIFAQSIKEQGETIRAGGAGDIDILASELLELRRSATISVDTASSQKAGSIRIVAPVVVVADGAAISALTGNPDDLTSTGDGGDIDIRAASSLKIESFGSISVRTRGRGNAGVIAIRGAELVTIENGEIGARSESRGKAGDILLEGVGTLSVGQGGKITTETTSDGLGGSITIDADQQVLVINGGTISATSTGTRDAGNIAIDAGQRFSARNGGQVTTSAVAADGGDIEIGASRLIYIQDGRVTTDVRAGLGSGGNITLDPEFVVLNHAELRASAVGDGGNITIVTDRFVRDASSVVDASSELGIDGEIQTTSPTVDLTSELVQLDTTFLDASSKLAAACAARAGQRGTFAVRGRTRAASPEAPLGSTNQQQQSESDCDPPQP